MAFAAGVRAQGFNATITHCNSAVGGTETYNFTGATANANAQAWVVVRFRGDLDFASSEWLDIYGENNTYLGRVQSTSQCNPNYEVDSFSVNMADINAWAANGTVTIEARAGSGVNSLSTCVCGLGGSGVAFDCQINLKYPVSTVPNDIGVMRIDSPFVFCPGAHDVVVTVGNYGTNQIDSFTVNWSINGIPQTPVVETNVTLDTANGLGSTTHQLTLGSYTFSAGVADTIVAWTSLPNNRVDTVTRNDSASAVRQPSISGSYTIDPAGSGVTNYTSFGDLAQDLSDFGVCGPVIVTVKPGTYTEQVEFGNITGASAMNYIEFSSDTGGIVTVTHNAGFGSNYTLLLDNADWITFNDITFEAAGSSYATVISLENGASNNTFNNCVFNGYSSSTFSSNQSIWYTRSAGNNDNHVENCEFNGGSYGMYFFGGGTSARNERNEFLNNTFTDQYYRGMYCYYTEDLKINYNVFRSSRNYSSMYVIMSYYSYNASEIIGNDINTPGYAGIYMLQYNGTVNERPLVANNMVRIGRGAGSYGYGIYCTSSGYVRLVHNTVVTTHSIGTYGGIYVSGGANEILNNNVFVETLRSGSSYGALYYNGGFAVFESDYNNVYVDNGGAFGRLGSQQLTLSDWQNATGFDMNSLNTNPGFVNFDSLRTCSDTLESAGTPLSYVTDDFDGDGRNPNAPDIGADEWIGSDSNSFSAGPDAIVCDGKSVIIGTSSSSSSFTWNTGDTTGTIEVSQAGEYVVSVTTACGATQVDTVIVTDATPEAEFGISSVFLTGQFDNQSQNDWSRMWVVGTTPPDTFYSDDLTYVFPDNGPYDVTLYVYNDCDTDMVTKTWTGFVGIAENDLANAIAVMPNPASDVLNIEFSGLDGAVTVEMTNVQGQVVHTDRYMNVKGNARESIDVSSLNKGMYIVRFITDLGVTTKQIVVQ